ncbi:MAG: tetrahydromethanopterin S-methyltransferase subunit G [Emergencia timonensis]|uniref:tetrahydromethanopterin S-methyltransferase subunit G n=1 Tax=Emergencia timonensis TaxID=1776384 RepID=UPI000A4E3ED7|nr:tetrahydromethanopterin S-methyltransferase subunit G [Emergencia timonensis]WNX87777.1 tetrahydromethanopterin S-methyltransferase subunit G [Emergencia timonensis]
MNYNQFYRRKDKYKRKITQSEKKNAQRLGISFGKSILAGMVCGLVILVLYKLFM